ncbi:MAG: metal ABC transporter permease [Verrucomicrobiales bacterium]|nr:metal ABC transporter permease [Verrucomicrobiales bacterium]
MDSLLENIYLVRALIAAACLAPLCGLLGVFVTARRMAFFSDTIAHAALAGVALGFLLGFKEPTVPMVAFSLLIALAMFWLRTNTELLTDTIMALLLSGSVALGIIILSMLKGFRAELHSYLFGDIQAVGTQELVLAGILGALVTTSILWQLNSLSLLTAQEDLAHVCGIPVKRLNYFFVAILTLTVAASIRLLGVMLVTALIVIPPASARNISRNLRQHLLLSMAMGLVSGVAGVFLSYHFDFPTGPTIVMAAIGLFILTLVASRLRRLVQPGASPVTTV